MSLIKLLKGKPGKAIAAGIATGLAAGFLAVQAVMKNDFANTKHVEPAYVEIAVDFSSSSKEQPENETGRDEIEKNTKLLLDEIPHRESLEKVLSSLTQYDDYFEAASKTYNIEKSLLVSIAAVESKGKLHATSPAGAGGLMQFMPLTASAYGIERDNFVDKRYDPELAIDASAAYIRNLLDKFDNNEMLAVASYNCGETKVRKIVKRQGESWHNIKDHLPGETRDYVVKVLSRKDVLDTHSIELEIEQKQLFSEQYALHMIKPGETLYSISRNHGINNGTLLELNPELKNPNKLRPNYNIRVPTKS